MTVADYMAAEFGYWDEKADEEEWRAFHTMHQVGIMVDSSKHKLAPIDFMANWAVQWKGYKKGVSNEEYEEAMKKAREMTKRLNGKL